MKPLHLISTLLLLFVVYATRVDATIKKIFSENITTEYLDTEQTENEADEKQNEECNDDCSIAYSKLQNQLHSLIHFQTKLNVFAVYHKKKHPSIPIESPPPKS